MSLKTILFGKIESDIDKEKVRRGRSKKILFIITVTVLSFLIEL